LNYKLFEKNNIIPNKMKETIKQPLNLDNIKNNIINNDRNYFIKKNKFYNKIIKNILTIINFLYN